MRTLLQLLLLVAALVVGAAAQTATVSWTFDTTAQSWVATVGASSTAAWTGTDGSPSAGSLQTSISGRSKSNANFWQLTGTWAALFGIPSNAVVSQVGGGTSDGHVWKCSTFTTGATSSDGPFELRDSGGTLLGTFSTASSFSGTTAWSANVAASAISISQSAGTTINLRLNNALATGASNSAVVTLRDDTITLTVTYSVPTCPPNALLLVGAGCS